MIFVLAGNPIPKKRHRSCLRHGKIHSYDEQYDDKTTVAWKLETQLIHASRCTNSKISEEAQSLKGSDYFEVSMEFYISVPESTPTTKRNQMLWSSHAIVKPDLDNMVKFYLDAGNKILWDDDKKIVDLRATKVYSENPSTIIMVNGKKHMAVNEKIQGILGVFPPNRYYEMLRDIQLLAEMESIPNRSQQNRAADAAYVLSRFADNYSDELKKIKKCFPGYWQDCIPKSNVDKKGQSA